MCVCVGGLDFRRSQSDVLSGGLTDVNLSVALIGRGEIAFVRASPTPIAEPDDVLIGDNGETAPYREQEADESPDQGYALVEAPLLIKVREADIAEHQDVLVLGEVRVLAVERAVLIFQADGGDAIVLLVEAR